MFGSIQTIHKTIWSMPKGSWYLDLSKTIWLGPNMLISLLDRTKFPGPFGVDWMFYGYFWQDQKSCKVLFYCWVLEVLCVFWILVSYQIYDLHVSCSISCLLTLVIVSFDAQTFWISLKSNLICFFFVVVVACQNEILIKAFFFSLIIINGLFPFRI